MNESKTMKLAVVSGGSRGLGAALCERYLSKGYQVVEFSRTAPHSFSVCADFSDPPSANEIFNEKLFELAQESYDEVVIINNVGLINPVGATARKERELIIGNVNVNFTTPILFISEAVKHFQAQEVTKTLAHISSGAAQHGYAGLSLYCAAKAGMENFMRSLALEQELESHPFQVVTIDPGVMDTDMQRDIRASDASDFPSLDRFQDLKRSGTLRPPVQVAAAIARMIAQNTRSGVRYSVADFLQ